ncbi:hypothetical protein V2J09_016980 [Rumex salicifolius]
MALFRKFFYQKSPDRLLEISERIYVFDCCFSTVVLDENEYKTYMDSIVTQLQGHFPESSYMVFNFREGENKTQISDILSQYDMTVTEYPQQYKNCPILPTEIIHHFLRSSDSWLSLKGQQNVLLMHCERGGWPLLAFMLAGLLLYRQQYNWEQKTLEMIYKQAPRELLRLLSPLNPQPSQLRYLQYISRKNMGLNWPPMDTPLVLDSLVLKALPKFDMGRSCRPVVRVYGQDPLSKQNTGPKLLFSSLKARRRARNYPEMQLVKLVIGCGVQGDVVLECVHLRDDSIKEEMMFRVMFNTAFVHSHSLTLTRDEIDLLWDTKDRYPKDFTAEVLFSDVGAVPYPIHMNTDSVDETDADGASIDQFYQVQEILNNAVDGKPECDIKVAKEINLEEGNKECSVHLEDDMIPVNDIDEKRDSTARVVGDEVEEKQTSRSKSPPLKMTIDVVRHKSDKLLQYVTKRRPQTLHQKSFNSSVLVASPHVRIIPPSISSTRNRSDDSTGGAKLNSAQEDSSSPTKVTIIGAVKEFSPSSSSSSHAQTLIDEPLSSSLKSISYDENISPPTSQVINGIASITCPKCGALIPSLSTCNREIPIEPKKSSQPPPNPPSPPQPSRRPSTPQPPPPPLPPGGKSQPSKPQPPPPPLLPESRIQASTSQPPPPPLPPGGRGQPSAPPPPPPPPRGRDPPTPPPPLIQGGITPPPPPQSRIPGPPGGGPPRSGGTPAPPIAPAPPRRAGPPAPPGGTGPPTPLERGGGGGPPAPPPGEPKGSMGGRGRLTRSAAITTVAAPGKQLLKPLHWSKVTRVAKGTLWDELQGRTQIEGEVDLSEIESLFSTIPSKPAKKSGQKKVAPKSEVIHLVDLRRANNTEIMLTKVKMPLSDMMIAALALDESVLDADQVENLIKFCPTKEEMDLLKNYTGDMEKLGKCEQFFLELMKVPRVESKLTVFLFKIQFSTQAEDFRNSLTVVLSACDEVRNSSKLKEVMRLILLLGNTLNNGTARGGASGFKLDSLLKLNETRATNSRMTLMHYLGKVLAKSHPDILDFPQDFRSLEAASKIQLKSLAEEMQTITKGLEKAKVELAASAKDGHISATFCKTLKEFIGSAETEVASVLKMYAIAGRNADSLAAYFGEEPALAQTLLNFMKSFVKAQEDNIKEAELIRKRAQKEAAEMEKSNGGNSSGKEEDNET